MKIEINENLQEQNTTFTNGNSTIMITPTIDEDYYLFRVHLYKDQYLLAFPKFSTLGIGFAQEEDWNCNLPYTCEAEEIYNHIKHNKKYKKEIKKKDVIKAIILLQVACEIYMFCKKDEKNKELKKYIKDLQIRKDRYYLQVLEYEKQISDWITFYIKINDIISGTYETLDPQALQEIRQILKDKRGE